MRDDLRGDFGSAHVRLTDCNLVAADHQHVGELDFGADLSVQLFDANLVAFGNPILFSACLNDRVHGESVNP